MVNTYAKENLDEIKGSNYDFVAKMTNIDY